MSERLAKEIYSQYCFSSGEKAAVGRRGVSEQAAVNRRFYSGDQWAANAPANRPLVRYNVIRRIGDYKTSAILSAPLTVRFSALGDASKDENTVEAVQAMSDYFTVVADRIGFDRLMLRALTDAYITGTGVVYAYWDPEVRTGRYLDRDRKLEIRGDIKCETVGVENLFLGDIECTDIQQQPYIIIARRMSVEKARVMAAEYGSDPDLICPDGGLGNRVTVLTRLRKLRNKYGETEIRAAVVTETAVIRQEFSTGVRIYPVAAFRWNDDSPLGYGESEVTNIIPNQIAINRMLTASVWSVMLSGMPIMAVNRNLVPNQSLTNEPGQVIDYTGPLDQISNSVKYFTPPDYLNNYNQTVSSLISQTLNQTGANAVVLGDVDPTNTSAIIAVRDSAMSPIKVYKRRFYEFCGEVAKLFAEFWVMMYMHRELDIQSGYIFDGDKFMSVLIGCTVDVSESAAVNEEQSLSVLNMLLDKGKISVGEYLSHIPRGLVPDSAQLIEREETENDG